MESDVTQALRREDSLPLSFSTATLAAGERLAVWHEVYGQNLFNLDIEPIGEQPFRASIRLQRLGAGSITTGTRSASHARITRRHLGRARDSIMLIALRRGRAIASQAGREAELGSGDVVALSSSETAQFTLIDEAEYLSLYLPRSLLAPIVPRLGDRLCRRLCRDTSSLDLLLSYAATVQANPLTMGASLQQHLVDHLCDLAANSLLDTGATDRASPDESIHGGLRAARLQAIQARIGAGLDDHAFTIDAVALALRISPSYIRKLLAGQGTSFTEMVVQQRLRRAFARLQDPAGRNLTIGAIAYEAGFSDLSYFNRCFRRQFDATPGEIRKQMQIPS
jgi:AraC-like DNA-binding protein